MTKFDDRGVPGVLIAGTAEFAENSCPGVPGVLRR
jgi:hypothetical protein